MNHRRQQYTALFFLTIAFFLVVPVERLHHCHAKAAAMSCELHEEDVTHIESEFPDCEVFHQHRPAYLFSLDEVADEPHADSDFQRVFTYRDTPCPLRSTSPPRAPPV